MEEFSQAGAHSSQAVAAMEELSGKVAFITGGGSGLGLALAHVFGRAGARIAIIDREQERVEQAVHELLGRQITAAGFSLDVTDRAAYAQAAEAVERQLGPVQLLFNNAGVGVMQRLGDASYEDWDWVLGVNLGGVVNGLCTFLPRMRARCQGGHVVSTASAAGLFASDNLGIYVASKMAVVGITEVLRSELAVEGIGASVICPHLMRTRIPEHASQRPARYARAQTAKQGAVPSSEEISDRARFGMDPMEVAEHTLAAVRENRLYVIPYPELRGIIGRRFEAILSALPVTQADPTRVAAEAPTLTFAPYEEALARSGNA
jgi:NAD(P)-dependent dehydrogenase (short-subunit alcohol dehydrogenase family)